MLVFLERMRVSNLNGQLHGAIKKSLADAVTRVFPKPLHGFFQQTSPASCPRSLWRAAPCQASSTATACSRPSTSTERTPKQGGTGVDSLTYSMQWWWGMAMVMVVVMVHLVPLAYPRTGCYCCYFCFRIFFLIHRRHRRHRRHHHRRCCCVCCYYGCCCWRCRAAAALALLFYSRYISIIYICVL